MTPPFSRPDATAGSGQYLAALVDSASPAQLRLMLIEKAIDVSSLLVQLWRDGQQLGPNEHSIKLLDLLNELLSGVVGQKAGQNPEVCNQVADLYVFLCKHVVAAEAHSDAGAIDEIKSVLEVEADTWRAVVAQSAGSPAPAPGDGQSGLDLTG